VVVTATRLARAPSSGRARTPWTGAAGGAPDRV